MLGITQSVLVILVDFSDNSYSYNQDSFENLIFGITGSVREYYDEVSYGRLDINGEVFGWVRLNTPYSYYCGDSFGIYGQFPNNSQGFGARRGVQI